jgi:hypothetical protein
MIFGSPSSASTDRNKLLEIKLSETLLHAARKFSIDLALFRYVEKILSLCPLTLFPLFVSCVSPISSTFYLKTCVLVRRTNVKYVNSHYL